LGADFEGDRDDKRIKNYRSWPGHDTLCCSFEAEPERLKILEVFEKLREQKKNIIRISSGFWAEADIHRQQVYFDLQEKALRKTTTTE
jgi:hypothetical protein